MSQAEYIRQTKENARKIAKSIAIAKLAATLNGKRIR